MGPNLFISPPGGITQLHLDAFGTVDSGHLCLSGYNEVLLFDRMSAFDMNEITKQYSKVSPKKLFANHITLVFTMISMLTQK